MLEPGARVGRYRIEERLGRGGAGYVYRAFDTHLQRHVALKILQEAPAARDEEDSQPRPSERLLREARSAARIHHPNVIAIFDVAETEHGTAYLAMELVDGKTLRTRISDADVSLRTRVEWLADIARALAVAHAAGIVHRDVKPDNVMVCADGVVKVLDFGIAKRVPIGTDEDAPPPSQITQDGLVRGTPRYMAPEQLLGEPLDGRTDQFAWGLLAYELLSGTHPFAGQSPNLAVLGSTIARLRERAPAVPSEIESIVMRALVRRRDGRHPSMDVIVTELEDASKNLDETTAAAAAAPPPPSDAAETVEVKTAPRRQREAARDSKESDADGSTPPRTESRRPIIAYIVAGGVVVALVAFAATRRSEATHIADAAPSAMRVTDRPRPTGTPEAVVAYVAAMQSLRDGAVAESRRHLEDAVAADPSMPAAWLRLAELSIEDRPLDSRSWYRKAGELRETLDPHDAMMLDAVGPHVATDPPDPAAAERALVAACEKMPGDPELLYYLARVRLERHDEAGAIEAAERAIASDAAFGAAYAVIAVARHGADKPPAIERCLAAAPRATACLAEKLVYDREIGDCARLEADAKQYVAISPDVWLGYEALADALAERGASMEAVREATAQATSRYVPPLRDGYAALADAHVAMLEGSFAAAEKRLLDYQAAKARDRRERSQGGPALTLVALYTEIGKKDEAARVASAFVARLPGLVTGMRHPERAIAEDPVPRMLRARLDGGEIKPDDFHRELDAWTRAWRERAPASLAGHVWARGWGSTAETKDEAIAALASLGDAAPVQLSPVLDAAYGRTLLLAGHPEQAIAHLEHATRSCAALAHAIPETQAFFDLGRAREETNDRPGACEAYRVVTRRWGGAAASKTGAAAREGERRTCK